MESEIKRTRKTWKYLKKMTLDRSIWKDVVVDICLKGAKKEKKRKRDIYVYIYIYIYIINFQLQFTAPLNISVQCIQREYRALYLGHCLLKFENP
jgi:hypothetical protein